jgi:hypothetical protein
MVMMPRTRKSAKPTDTTQLIGDDSQGGFVSCPNCGRPVADGLVRCAGCGTRVLMGVTATRALLFMATGAVLGLLVGGLSVGTVMNASRAAAAAASTAAAHGASPSPSAGASSSAIAGLASPSRPAIDPLAASALRQVASTDDQMAIELDNLKHELRSRTVDTGAIAATLRAMSASATYGTSVIGYLSAWPDAAPLQGQLGALYTQIRAVAANGLAAQLASVKAYVTAGNQMVAVLAVLPTLRTAELALGQSGGIVLPGASMPVATPAASPVPSPSPSG